MSALQAEVYDAFRVLEVPDKALRAAVDLSAALTKAEDETPRSFSRRDADVEAIRKDIAGINTRVASMQGDLNGRMASMQTDLHASMASMESGLNTRMASMESGLNARMTSMQGEINLLKWMMGTVITLLVTVLFRVFTH